MEIEQFAENLIDKFNVEKIIEEREINNCIAVNLKEIEDFITEVTENCVGRNNKIIDLTDINIDGIFKSITPSLYF